MLQLFIFDPLIRYFTTGLIARSAMKSLFRFVFAGVICALLFLCYSCNKDSLSKYDTAVVNMKIFDDDSIALPISVTAGDNCLLSAYNTSSGELKFNLTGNDGKLIWQKQFEVNSISAILKENDGTFSIISGLRLINIDRDGMVLRDVADAFPGLFQDPLLFGARINRNNNYIIYGMYSTGQLGFNRAFAAEYRHDGTQIFMKQYIDTIGNVLSNRCAITGCEFTDDGGYIFSGNFYAAYWTTATDLMMYNIIRTDNEGLVIWQKHHVLLDSLDLVYYSSDQLPFNTNVYGYHEHSFTHEVMRTADGNYLCFVNVPDYLSPDQSARIYKIDPDGNMIDSTFIDFAKYNRFMGGLSYYYKYSGSNTKSYSCGDGIVKNSDNTFSICMQNGFFGSKGLTSSYLAESRSFVVRIDQDLNILDTRYLQSYYSDCFNSACRSSDGRTVYFGLISSLGNKYKPALIFSNDK